MANYCLTKPLAEEFKKRLKNGEINPEKLAAMTSAERHAYFASFLGEHNATNVNSLFESKLLLKSQKQGMISWAKKVTGISKTTRADLLDKINKLDNVLNPQEEEKFLNDLVNTRLGVEVTQEEAKNIFDLSQKSSSLKEQLQNDPNNKDLQRNYGLSVLDTMNYINEIQPNSGDLLHNIAVVANLPRTLVATFDVSAPFRHSWASMSRADFWKNYAKMYTYLGSENNYKNMMADIIGHPDYEILKDSKLRISDISTSNLSQREDDFMSPILDKFPLTRASERAYVGFLNGLRADMFYRMINAERLRGGDITPGSKASKEIADIVNILTGTSNVGRNEQMSEFLNSVNFSFRKTKADFSLINPLTYIRTNPTARREALRSVLGTLGIVSTILFLAGLAGHTTFDTNNADFGKIRIGNTRIDVTGGRGSMIVLLSRLISGKLTSSITGKTYQLGQGYKPITRMSLLLGFERNKLSPFYSSLVDLLVGTDFAGQKVTLSKEVQRLFVPMLIQDAIEISNSGEGIGTALMGIGLSMLGIPVSSYSNTKTKSSTQ